MAASASGVGSFDQVGAVELIDRRWWWVVIYSWFGWLVSGLWVLDRPTNKRSKASKQQSVWSLAAVQLELSMAG